MQLLHRVKLGKWYSLVSRLLSSGARLLHKLCYAGPGEAGPRPEGRAAERERKGGRGGAGPPRAARKHASTEARKHGRRTAGRRRRTGDPRGRRE